jgi:hypothetical protein
MDEAAPAAGGAAGKKRPLLRRVPTSLIVTLLGIALTAWLLPAFTRQWADRQNAHEVQAALVADMASATARTFQSGDAMWISLPTCGLVVTNFLQAQFPRTKRVEKCAVRGDRQLASESAKIDAPWSLASAEIEARMRAYLNPRVVTAWQLFSWFMGAYDGSRETHTTVVRGQLDFLAADQNDFNLKTAAARDVGAVLKVARRDGIGGILDHDVRYLPAFGHLKKKLRSYHAFTGPTRSGYPAGQLNSAFGDIAIALSAFEQEIALEVLNSHVTGYSTTTRDLLHDLIP